MRYLLILLLLSGVVSGREPNTRTPGETAIVRAETAIAKDPNNARAYCALAMAHAKRARETADPEQYRLGLKAVERSLELEPENYEARRSRVWLLLGQHEFAKALEQARELNKTAKDDILVYGFLADANVELGNYDEAETAAQWMLDLRPGNVAGLTRGAYLREIYGDLEGALDFMQQALQRTPPNEVEDRAWILTQIAHLEIASGRLELAQQAVGVALELFPGYHYALGQKARIAAAREDWAEAAKLFQARYDAAPHPENLYEVAVALHRSGNEAAAAKTFVEFEKAAMAEMESVDNSNRELVAYWTEFAGKTPAALELAAKEIERRKDVHTRSTYAWALYRAGRTTEAKTEMKQVLAIGTRAPEILHRAAEMGL